MTYIITTTTYRKVGLGPTGQTQLAVATLDDVTVAVQKIVNSLGFRFNVDDLAATYWGNPVGPLPDDTVIEVRRVTTNELAKDAGMTFDEWAVSSEQVIIDTYNERKAVDAAFQQ